MIKGDYGKLIPGYYVAITHKFNEVSKSPQDVFYRVARRYGVEFAPSSNIGGDAQMFEFRVVEAVPHEIMMDIMRDTANALKTGILISNQETDLGVRLLPYSTDGFDRGKMIDTMREYAVLEYAYSGPS